MRRKDFAEKFQRPWGNIRRKDRLDSVDYVDYVGIVATKHGFVEVYSTARGTLQRTSLRFIFKGKLFARYEDKFYSKRYLVTLAARFAEEVVNVGGIADV